MMFAAEAVLFAPAAEAEYIQLYLRTLHLAVQGFLAGHVDNPELNMDHIIK